MELSASVTKISGVGEERAKKMQKLGIETVRDLLFFFPRTYEVRGDVTAVANAPVGSTVSLVMKVGTDVTFSKTKNGRVMYSFRAYDESGSIFVIFFQSPYVKQIFRQGMTFRFYGKLSWFGKTLAMTSPKYEPLIPGIPLPYYHPVYPLTAGLNSKTISSIVHNALDTVQNQITDPLPEDIRLSYRLPTLAYAVKNAHFPLDRDALSMAVRRLAFDELFAFALLIAKVSEMQRQKAGVRIEKPDFAPLDAALPFSLTDGQKNAINEILSDMTEQKNGAMSRILIGDVGSGKTVCALYAAYAAIRSGTQVAFMAPTEILASQHFAAVQKIFKDLKINAALLLGSTKKSERTKILSGVKSGDIHILIGTHALLNDEVEFQKLGLLITDEQHRFGIKQRANLKSKNESAHVLVMSATPIPRSLALALYGDLNVSRIFEMPKGRQRVDTYVIDESYRERLFGFIDKQIKLGGQCYVVCPGIIDEENEEEESRSFDDILSQRTDAIATKTKSVTSQSEELKTVFPNYKIGILHGKMKPAEKEAVMEEFRNGSIKILVSTTVVEVGVDNPNATLMIVENADRFGLSQLHQLRGRVGRDDKKSYCILISDAKTENGTERLNIMKSVYDGFMIAEKDLIMRGPGDFFSSNQEDSFKQSGEFHFRFASAERDEKFMESVFATAKSLIAADPQLKEPSHLALQSYILPYVDTNITTIS